MSFDETLELPLRRFWFLVNMGLRIRAEADLRRIHVLTAAGGGKTQIDAEKSLTEEMGPVYIWEDENKGPLEIQIDPEAGLDPEFDREGLNQLKGMSLQKQGQFT